MPRTTSVTWASATAAALSIRSAVAVAFQNSLFCLTLEQFEGFCEMIQDRLAMRPVSTSHGKELLLVTPMPNYFLLFSESDLSQLTDLLREAAPVLAAERILGADRMN